jgi:hypothetical protein
LAQKTQAGPCIRLWERSDNGLKPAQLLGQPRRLLSPEGVDGAGLAARTSRGRPRDHPEPGAASHLAALGLPAGRPDACLCLGVELRPGWVGAGCAAVVAADSRLGAPLPWLAALRLLARHPGTYLCLGVEGCQGTVRPRCAAGTRPAGGRAAFLDECGVRIHVAVRLHLRARGDTGLVWLDCSIAPRRRRAPDSVRKNPVNVGTICFANRFGCLFCGTHIAVPWGVAARFRAVGKTSADTTASSTIRCLTARAGNRRFRRLSALRARTKAPYKMDVHRGNRDGRLTAPGRPGPCLDQPRRLGGRSERIPLPTGLHVRAREG